MQHIVSATRLTLRDLFRPRGQTGWFVGFFAISLLLGWLFVTRLAAPLWMAAVITLLLLAFPALRKWEIDRRELGLPLTLLSVLLVTQGLHTVEHITQWVQFHLLGWPLKASSGIISPLNAEIVHFAWNWGVFLTVAYLVGVGLRGPWMWALLLWSGAHTVEHTYMFINYLQAGGVQGLPGFFGKGGWLAQNMGTSGPMAFICNLLPGFVEAPRLDVHFWWNIGEVSLLWLAAWRALRT
jgi:hypothetical protein